MHTPRSGCKISLAMKLWPFDDPDTQIIAFAVLVIILWTIIIYHMTHP